MKNIFVICSLLLLQLPTWGFQAPPMKEVVINEVITVTMPKSFRPMTDDEVVAEYTVYRKPLAMFKDDQMAVNYGINVSASRWENKDLAILKSFYKATLLDLYSDVDFMQDTLITQGNYQYAVFEFTSAVKQSEREASIISASPIRKYTYIQYTIVNGNVMVFNFSCSSRLQYQWAEAAKEMMEGIKLK